MAKSPKASDMPCATCELRARAQANPQTIMARIWTWHTKWCPGWKKYQAMLAAEADEWHTKKHS